MFHSTERHARRFLQQSTTTYGEVAPCGEAFAVLHLNCAVDLEDVGFGGFRRIVRAELNTSSLFLE